MEYYLKIRSNCLFRNKSLESSIFLMFKTIQSIYLVGTHYIYLIFSWLLMKNLYFYLITSYILNWLLRINFKSNMRRFLLPLYFNFEEFFNSFSYNIMMNRLGSTFVIWLVKSLIKYYYLIFLCKNHILPYLRCLTFGFIIGFIMKNCLKSYLIYLVNIYYK